MKPITPTIPEDENVRICRARDPDKRSKINVQRRGKIVILNLILDVRKQILERAKIQ